MLPIAIYNSFNINASLENGYLLLHFEIFFVISIFFCLFVLFGEDDTAADPYFMELAVLAGGGGVLLVLCRVLGCQI